MKRAVLLAVIVLLMQPVVLVAQVAEGLRTEAKIRETVLAGQMQDLIEVRAALTELWTRLDLQSGNLMRAQEQGETVDSLRLRDEDIRQVEGAMLDNLLKAQQLRRSLLENATMLAAINEEIQRLTTAVGEASAVLSGTWRFVVDPGQEGLLFMQQQGTLVSGTYAISGGFSGSLRGTFVAGKVRLERIDSQIGFAAIFYGRLVGSGSDRRLQGTWEATQLASGLPSAGTWTATRVVDTE
jgi:hypothetical protein